MYNSLIYVLSTVGENDERRLMSSAVEVSDFLMQDMIWNKIAPTNVTRSMLLKLYVNKRQFRKGIDLLKTMSARFYCVPEPRLYKQLLQGCIRANVESRVLVEVEGLIASRGIRIEQSDYYVSSTGTNNVFAHRNSVGSNGHHQFRNHHHIRSVNGLNRNAEVFYPRTHSSVCVEQAKNNSF